LHLYNEDFYPKLVFNYGIKTLQQISFFSKTQLPLI